MTEDADVIDAYLDRLLLELRGRTPDVRRVLAEVESHLRDAVSDGASPEEAIARFGSPRAVARRFDGTGLPVLPDLFRLAWQLAAIGCIAIGLSAGVAAIMRATLGDAFVAGDQAGVTYTPARCADFLEYHPQAISCEAAASAHHADEVESYRAAAGVMGLVGLGLWRWRLRGVSARLRSELGPTIAAVAFGLATVGLTAQGLAMLAQGRDHGAGQWLSGAAVAALGAGWYGWRLLRDLRAVSLVT